MESLKLDSSGDLVMKDGELQLVSNADELIQTFKTLLQTNKNEWFLNPEMGFDYSVINGVRVIDEEDLSFALQDVADQMDEIDRIEDIQIEYSRQTRQALIKCRAITVDGDELEIEEVF